LSPEALTASSSTSCHEPFRNCSIRTRIPCPTARSAVPMAAVVFPLPGPVFTMMRPRRRSDIKPNLQLYGAAITLPNPSGLNFEENFLAPEKPEQHPAEQDRRQGIYQ